MDGEFLEIIFELTEIEHCNVIIMICQKKIILCYSKFLNLNLLDSPHTRSYLRYIRSFYTVHSNPFHISNSVIMTGGLEAQEVNLCVFYSIKQIEIFR
jgi:hypothetical protein